MYSAKYIASVAFRGLFNAGKLENPMNAVELVQKIYNQLAFPFLKLLIYLSLGILVIIMMIRVFTYITSQDEGTKKKSLGVVVRTTIGMLFIIAAKQVVEAIYGKQNEVLQNVDNL